MLTQEVNIIKRIRGEQSRRAKQVTGQPEVFYSQDGEGPTLHIAIADIHWGHEAVDYAGIERLRELILTTDRVRVSLLGDIVEGLQPEYLSTNVMHLIIQDTLEQLISFRDYFIKPLVEQGKLAAIVDDYTPSHDRWMSKLLGMNPNRVLTDGFEIKMVQNGGVITFTYPDGKEEKFRAYHNTAKSGTSVSPLTGLSNSETVMPGYVDVALAGHLHHLGGSRGTYKGPTGKMTTYGQIPGFKTGTVLPDLFEMQSGRSQHDVPAGLATLQYEIDGDHHTYTTTIDQAMTLFRAARLRHLVDTNNASENLLERIHAEVEDKPEIVLNESKSKRRADDDSTDFLWSKLSYEVRSKLPISVLFAAGLRSGSGSKTEDQKLFRQIIGEASNSHSFLLVLRRMIDAGVEHHADREIVVGKLLKTLEPVWNTSEDRKILAWLMDGILRYEDWKNPKKKRTDRSGKTVYDDPEGFMAATHISEKTGAPLLANQGRVNILLRDGQRGKPKSNHSIMVLDRLEGSGSRTDATQGLFTIANRGITSSVNHIPDIIVGGNMPGGGYATRPIAKTGIFQTAIAPGWLANEHGEGGKGNRGPGTKGGYGIFLLPDSEVSVPVSTVQESAYWYETLMLFYGLEQLGGVDHWMNALDTRHGTRD